MNTVPTIGFRSEPYEKSTITIEKNTSIFNNEVVAHRIAMVPIFVPPDFTHETFPLDRYEFHLDVTNDTKVPIDVTTKDFKIWDKTIAGYITDTKTFLPPDPITSDYILLFSLNPKANTYAEFESIKVKAELVLGNGKENSHFNPTSQVAYTFTVDEKLAAAGFEDLKTQAAKKKGAELTEADIESLKKKFDSLDKARFYKKNEEGDPTDYDFSVETLGTISARSAVQKGWDYMARVVQAALERLEKGDDSITIINTTKAMIGFDILFDGEEHTLGNILQFAFLRNPSINYAGYFIPHPLKKSMTVSVSFVNKDDNSFENVKKVLSDTLANIVREIRYVADEWRDFTKVM
jgi:DNA-directed RNA polymerase subunit L